MPERRLGVVGSPIAHSLSPVLHRAAYRTLGLDWGYDRHEVRSGGLEEFVDGLDRSWRGLSATMPLKEEVAALADGADRIVALTGAANTLLLDGGRRIARNTDVAGVERALRDAGADAIEHAVVVGAGATARSVIVALDALGARAVTVLVRDPARAVAAAELCATLGVELDLVDLAHLRHLVDGTDVVAWTLPNGVPLPGDLRLSDAPDAIALDVTYSPWPGPLAAPWLAAGGRVASGRDMLLHQAVRQMRFFVSGQTESPLPEEDAVEAAMRAALPEAS